MKKYPKQVFVWSEKHGNDDPFLLVAEDKDEITDGIVAVYALVKVGSKSTITELKF